MAYANIPPEFLTAGGDTIDATTGGGSPEAADLIVVPAGVVGDFMVLLAYAADTSSTPGWSLSSAGTSHEGWVVAGTSLGAVSTSSGSMIVWTKQVTADNEATLGPLFVTGPAYKSCVWLTYADASALDGPVVFTLGTGATATTAAKTLAARQSRVVTAFASRGGPAWTPDGTTFRHSERYIGFTRLTASDTVPGATGDTDTYAATTTSSTSWLTAILAVAPLTIPDPPGGGGTGGSGTGVHFSPGLFQPTPVLILDNSDIAGGPGDPTRPVALDGFRIRWGRDRITDQPEPATGRVSLWFTSESRAAAWAAADGLPGQLLELAWEGTVPGDTEPTRERFFRGRINALTIRAHRVRNPDGSVTTGAIVELTLSSVLNDLQNITPRETWPEETLGDRLARVQVYAAPYVDIDVRDYWEAGNVQPIAETSQQTVLDHIYALFDSSGADRLTYLPDTNEIRPVLRRSYDFLRTLAQLWADPADAGPGRAGKGAYIRTLDVWPAGLTADDANPPNYLDAAALEYDPAADGLTLGPDQRITRVELTHPDSTADTPYESRTVVSLVPGINETTHGVRAATITSQLVWPDWADTAAIDLTSMVGEEGQEFKLAPIVWSTRKTGGFETVEQVRYLLKGAETPELVFLQRSVLPSFGVRPVFGVMGGEIGYAEGWDVALNLAPVRPPNVPQHPVSWEDIGADLVWRDTGDAADGFHESVTYEDLRYVGRGLGATTTPADDGWDY